MYRLALQEGGSLNAPRLRCGGDPDKDRDQREHGVDVQAQRAKYEGDALPDARRRLTETPG